MSKHRSKPVDEACIDEHGSVLFPPIPGKDGTYWAEMLPTVNVPNPADAEDARRYRIGRNQNRLGSLNGAKSKRRRKATLLRQVEQIQAERRRQAEESDVEVDRIRCTDRAAAREYLRRQHKENGDFCDDGTTPREPTREEVDEVVKHVRGERKLQVSEGTRESARRTKTAPCEKISSRQKKHGSLAT
jgi:hypothetical protein